MTRKMDFLFALTLMVVVLIALLKTESNHIVISGDNVEPILAPIRRDLPRNEIKNALIQPETAINSPFVPTITSTSTPVMCSITGSICATSTSGTSAITLTPTSGTSR